MFKYVDLHEQLSICYFQKRHACHFEECSKAYTSITHLKRHVRSIHQKDKQQCKKNVPCDVDTCCKMFTTLSNMQRHMREVHENPKIYKCLFCEEKFTQKLKMRRHEISKHTRVYPHSCEKCSRGFYQKWQWEKHRERCKVYPCPSCEKIFEKWSSFLKHCRDTQHSRTYYKCEYCERTYSKPVELQKHIMVKHLANENTTKVAYRCHHKGCNKSYAYEKNLRQHIITIHEGKKFKCTNDHCDKEFSSAQNVQKHISRKHSQNPSNFEDLSSFSGATLKRKKRKDAGISKISCLAKLSGVAVDRDLNKRLKCREESALEEMKSYLYRDIDIGSHLNSNNLKGDK